MNQPDPILARHARKTGRWTTWVYIGSPGGTIPVVAHKIAHADRGVLGGIARVKTACARTSEVFPSQYGIELTRFAAHVARPCKRCFDAEIRKAEEPAA